MEENEIEISLADIFRVLKTRWKLILFPALITAVLFGTFLARQPKSYKSYSLVKIGSAGGAPIESVPTISNIMGSFPMRQQIAEKLNEKDNTPFIEGLELSIEYSDEAGLLKIQAVDRKPLRAAEMVRVVTEMIIERHDIIYSKNQNDLDMVLKYVKKTISPIPLSCGITEFKITKSEIMVPAFVNAYPVHTKRRQTLIMVFFAVLFGTIILSFVLEGRKK